MEVAYLYTKVRSEFGKHCQFKDEPATIINSVQSTDSFNDHYVTKNPSVVELDTTPDMSEHEANTERLVMKTTSIRHLEGGWPKDVDYTEQADTQRFRKKAEKDDEFKASVKNLCPITQQCMRQNNTVDIYQDYFEDETGDYSSEPPSAKGLGVLRDPSNTPSPRTVTSINWQPEGSSKFAVAYSDLKFQNPKFMGSSGSSLPCQSYIWDMNNPNTPEMELVPPSPLVCLRYNPKSTDTLVGGCYNGLITFFDTRKPGGVTGIFSPESTSIIEKSHHDPVYDVFWVSSKTGNQCVSVSTDGQMHWWDARHLDAGPTDSLLLTAGGDTLNTKMGGSCMEYNTEAGPTKYLVGSEQGTVLSINLRNRKQNNGIVVYDMGPGKHHGPINSIQRNPSNSKFFMTVGDWTARIWGEDLKTPIMSTKYHNAYLTGGCWSPTRAGVFFVTRNDGVLDVWDYFYRQNEITYSHKVCDAELSSIAIQPSTTGGGNIGGRYVAVGDVNGTVSLLELCPSLGESQPSEKQAISAMFDRELKQEKNLEIRERDLRKAKQQQQEASSRAKPDESADKDDEMELLLREVDADFLQMIKEAEDEESKGEVGAEGLGILSEGR